MAYIVATSKNANDITCRIEGLDTSYSYNDREIDWYYNGVYKGTSSLGANVSSGGSFKATGLTSNTTYNIKATIFYTGGSITLTGTATTAQGVSLWEWTYEKTPGGTFNITPSEWLSFCNKINEVRVANGLSVYSFATSTAYISADKLFFVWIFLQAANAINEIKGQVATDCLNVKSWSESQGNNSIIYPWYFENLKTALNNAIV